MAKRIITITVFGLVWAALAYFTAELFFEVLGRGENFDLTPRWYGARYALEQGINPYGFPIYVEVIFRDGTIVMPDYGFLYPAYIIILLLPFWLMPLYSAIVTWASMQLLLGIGLLIVFTQTLEWKIPPLVLVLLILWSLFVYNQLTIVYLWAQFTVIVLFALLLTWWLVNQGYPFWAGFVLTYATIRPDGGVLALAVIIVLLVRGQWRVVVWWVTILTGITLLTFLRIGFWVPGFIQDVLTYDTRNFPVFPPALVEVPALTALIVGMVTLWAGFMLWHTSRMKETVQIGWVIAVTGIAVLLLIPQTNAYTLVYLLPAIWFSGWLSRDAWWHLPVMLILLAIPRFLILADISPFEQLFFPLAAAAALTFSLWRNTPALTDTA
jgi:hypothetical protein